MASLRTTRHRTRLSLMIVSIQNRAFASDIDLDNWASLCSHAYYLDTYINFIGFKIRLWFSFSPSKQKRPPNIQRTNETDFLRTAHGFLRTGERNGLVYLVHERRTNYLMFNVTKMNGTRRNGVRIKRCTDSTSKRTNDAMTASKMYFQTRLGFAMRN